MAGNRTKRKKRFRHFLGGAFLLSVACAICAELWLYPLLLAYGRHHAEALASGTISDRMAAVLSESQIAYGDLVKVERDEQGNVLSLHSDAMQLNLLQAKITKELLETFEQTDIGEFSIPLGTAFGGAFLSGRGPKITFRVALDGVAKTALRDEFTSAGINQTYHRVYLDITLQVLLGTMGRYETQEMVLPVVMAQTVLMGTVPNTYIQWG